MKKIKWYLIGVLCLFHVCLLHSQTLDSLYLVGFGKTDITYISDSLGLFGYGNYHQRIRKQQPFTSKIYSRAISIKTPSDSKQFIYVHADLGAIFQPLHEGLLKKIQENLLPNFKEANLIITASHTHCAPSGMSHHPLYMTSAPGFNPNLVLFTVEKMYDSVVQALESEELCTIRIKEGIFSPKIPIAFNRALKAYNKNEEIEKPLKREQTNLALNRNMPLMNFENENGETLGFINWFGVHPTEMQGEHNHINGASKGYAAEYAEKNMNSNAIAIFAQAAAGDVLTSDFHNHESFDETMKQVLQDSTYNHAFSSIKQAKWNGKKQAEKALEISNLNIGKQVKGPIDCELIYVDISKISLDEAFANGEKEATTSSACLGTPFLSGIMYYKDTNLTRKQLNFVAAMSKLSYYIRYPFLKKSKRAYKKQLHKSQAPKKIAIDAVEKSLFGIEMLKYNRKKMPTFLLNQLGKTDIVIGEILRQLKIGALEEHSLVPKILPLQILRIGNIAIVGLPTEITTIAHNRLQETILKSLKNVGVEVVFISSYANEYAGYTTTYEEYKVQRYEAGHTLFGRHQLGAFQTVFKKMAEEFSKPKAARNLDRKLRPQRFSTVEINKRSNLKPLK
ncbi:MAG: neutral/alkaline non-lysosomal ceramidase N-terminal domain-containing protein [Chitinophagales bacterium]